MSDPVAVHAIAVCAATIARSIREGSERGGTLTMSEADAFEANLAIVINADLTKALNATLVEIIGGADRLPPEVRARLKL